MLLLLSVAFAQAPEPPASVDEDVSEEVIVEADAVRRAREAVIRELTELGYDRVSERDGRVVLKHQDTWKGKIVLYDDGYLKHRRQGVRIVDGPAKELPKGTRWLPCIVVPTACIRTGLAVGKRKLDGVRHRTFTAIESELLELGDRLADASVAEVLLVLPDRLAGLWEAGVPLDGTARAPTFRARRAALLEFWDTRTETPWGHRIRDAVEAFVDGVVQVSDHPFSSREIERFNQRRSTVRAFVVRR